MDILPQICAKFILAFLDAVAYLTHILGISKAYLGHIMGISWAYFGHNWGISWPYLWPILVIILMLRATGKVIYNKPGWQKLAAFLRKWPYKLSSSAYLLFCDKCVVFARNYKFANLAQYSMQYIICNSAFLAQETLFLTQKKH